MDGMVDHGSEENGWCAAHSDEQRGRAAVQCVIRPELTFRCADPLCIVELICRAHVFAPGCGSHRLFAM